MRLLLLSTLIFLSSVSMSYGSCLKSLQAIVKIDSSTDLVSKFPPRIYTKVINGIERRVIFLTAQLPRDKSQEGVNDIDILMESIELKNSKVVTNEVYDTSGDEVIKGHIFRKNFNHTRPVKLLMKTSNFLNRAGWTTFLSGIGGTVIFDGVFYKAVMVGLSGIAMNEITTTIGQRIGMKEYGNYMNDKISSIFLENDSLENLIFFNGYYSEEHATSAGLIHNHWGEGEYRLRPLTYIEYLKGQDDGAIVERVK